MVNKNFFFFRVTNKLPYMPHISDTNILTCIKPMYKCIHVCFKGYYDVSKFIKPTGKYKDVFSRISQVLLSFLPQEGDICQFIANFNIPTHHTWFSLQSVHTLSAQINKIGLGIVPNNQRLVVQRYIFLLSFLYPVLISGLQTENLCTPSFTLSR